MKKTQQYINAKLFGHLFELGGQGLIGTYVMLLHGRKGYHCYTPFKNLNNKVTKGKRLLAKESNISLSALNTHLPMLVELGLCSFMPNGGFILLGDQKIKHKYNSYKKVPVVIGKNLRETKGNVNAVMITANLFRQVKQIDKKITLSKALRQEKKGIPLTKSQKRIVSSHRRNETELNKVENIVLSNKGISNLITGVVTDGGHLAVSKGGYWRKVLQKRGYIVSRRRYKTIWAEKISYSKFLSMKSFFTENYGFVTYKNGRVVKPIVSEVLLCNSIINSNIYNSSIINSSVEKTISCHS